MNKVIIYLLAVIFASSIIRADWGIFEATVTTSPVTNIGESTATSGGKIELLEDDPDVTEKGIVWSTSQLPTIDVHNGKTEQGAGPTSGNSLTFVSSMSGLQLGTKYYVRAYMTNENGTFYGQQRIFTTIPTLGEWGLIALGIMLAAFGGWYVMRRMG